MSEVAYLARPVVSALPRGLLLVLAPLGLGTGTAWVAAPALGAGGRGLMDAAVLTGPPEYLAHLVPGAGGAGCFLPLTKRPAVSHNGQSLAGGVGAHGTGRP